MPTLALLLALSAQFIVSPEPPQEPEEPPRRIALGVRSQAPESAQEEQRLILGIFTREPDELLARHLNVPPDGAIVITSVMEGHPAQKIGFEPGDVIVGIDGEPTATLASLREKLKGKKAGDTIVLEVVQRGVRRTFAVPLFPVAPSTEAAAASAIASLEFELEEVPELAGPLGPLSSAEALRSLAVRLGTMADSKENTVEIAELAARRQALQAEVEELSRQIAQRRGDFRALRDGEAPREGQVRELEEHREALLVRLKELESKRVDLQRRREERDVMLWKADEDGQSRWTVVTPPRALAGPAAPSAPRGAAESIAPLVERLERIEQRLDRVAASLERLVEREYERSER